MTKIEMADMLDDLMAERAELDKTEGDLNDADQARYNEIHFEIHALNAALN